MREPFLKMVEGDNPLGRKRWVASRRPARFIAPDLQIFHELCTTQNMKHHFYSEAVKERGTVHACKRNK